MINFTLHHFPIKPKNDFFVNIIKQTSESHCYVHSHEYLEIVYIYRGEGFHYIDGVEYAVKKGSLLVIPVGSIHRFESKTQMNFYNLGVKTDNLEIFKSNSENNNFLNALKIMVREFIKLSDMSRVHIEFENADVQKMEDIMEKIYDEIKNKSIGYELVILSLISEVFLYTMRVENKKEVMSKKKYNIDDILQYISMHYNEKITLQSLADIFYFNVSYLSRLIKEYTGETFSNYLQKIRVLKACEIIASSDGFSVEEIAGAVGYSSENLFYNHFKRHIGTTPHKYKKKYKE